MYSIVCCYNNYEEYQNNIENGLYRNLLRYDEQCELIGLDNTEKRFRSASEALNVGCQKATQEILIIVHQDIVVEEESISTLMKYHNLLQENLIVIGAAGKNKDGLYTNVKHGENHVFAGTNTVDKLTQVETIDECFFCISKKTWKTTGFNETLCDGWHLYAAEMCLNVRKNNGIVYVGALRIYHESQGVVDACYLETMKRICKTYREDFDRIRTMCFECPTAFPYFHLFFKRIRIFLRGIVKGY